MTYINVIYTNILKLQQFKIVLYKKNISHNTILYYFVLQRVHVLTLSISSSLYSKSIASLISLILESSSSIVGNEIPWSAHVSFHLKNSLSENSWLLINSNRKTRSCAPCLSLRPLFVLDCPNWYIFAVSHTPAISATWKRIYWYTVFWMIFISIMMNNYSK